MIQKALKRSACKGYGQGMEVRIEGGQAEV